MKKALSLLLALVLAFSLALPAFAYFEGDEGEEGGLPADYGIAKGYVRTKKSFKSSDGSVYTVASAYNKQGKLLKQAETSKSYGIVGTSTRAFAYDQKGNLTKETFLKKENGKDVEKQVRTFLYNKQGKPTQEKLSAGDYSYTIKNFYDEKGLLILEIIYHKDSVFTTFFTYDAKGKLKKEVLQKDFENGTHEKRTTLYTYDKKGNETKVVRSDVDANGNKYAETYTYAYNEKGQMTKSGFVSAYANVGGSKGTEKHAAAYAYDKKGNLTKLVEKIVYSDGGKRNETTVLAYDAKGHETKRAIQSVMGDFTFKIVVASAYDKKGNLTKTVRKESNGETATTITDAYAYDKAGNLTKYSKKINDGSLYHAVTTYAYKKIGA